MASPENEDASPSDSLFDKFYPDYTAQADTNTMPPLTCDCGYNSITKENFDRHKLACSERVANAVVKDILRQEDAVKERHHLAASQGPGFMDYFPRSSLPPNTSQSHDPRSPRVARPPFDFQTMQELPQDCMAETVQQPALTRAPQQPSYSDFLVDDFTPQQAYPQPQLGYVPDNDPYLNLYARNSGYASQWPGMDHKLLGSDFPFPFPHSGNTHPNSSDPQHQSEPRPSPPSRSANASVLSITSNTFKRVGTSVGSFLRGNVRGRGRGKGRGKSKKRSPSPSSTPEEVVTKQRKVNNAKQQKCRQKKADNQEALEAEVQRLRAILRSLGGCGEGEQIEGRNWF